MQTLLYFYFGQKTTERAIKMEWTKGTEEQIYAWRYYVLNNKVTKSRSVEIWKFGNIEIYLE